MYGSIWSIVFKILMWHNIIIGCKSEPLYYILIFIEFNVYLKKSVQRFFYLQPWYGYYKFHYTSLQIFLKKKKKKSYKWCNKSDSVAYGVVKTHGEDESTTLEARNLLGQINTMIWYWCIFIYTCADMRLVAKRHFLWHHLNLVSFL